MATSGTLLCIHRDPVQLKTLKDHGYRVLTATNGHDGLRLFMTRPVDAIVLEYHLGFLDGGVVAATIKKVLPQVPIVMLLDHLDVPDDIFKSVNMVVAKCDGDQFLVSAVKSVLSTRPVPRDQAEPSRFSEKQPRVQSPLENYDPKSDAEDKNRPFSQEIWEGILNGTVKFGSDA
jgi:CheY-like chemotaxis protein